MITKIFKNKKVLFLLALILIGSLYFIYLKFKNNQNYEGYILTKVEKGIIQKSISGTGYVTSTNVFDIKPSISGKILNIYIKEGDYVNKGQLLFILDDSDIKKQIRDLELEIENSKLSLAKAQDDYQKILRGDDLRKNYESLLKTLNDIFVDYPNDLEKIRKVYLEKELDKTEFNIEYYLYYFPEIKLDLSKIEKDLDYLKKEFVLMSNKLQIAKFNTPNIDNDLIKNSYNLVLKTQDFIKLGLDIIRRLKENIGLTQASHTKQDIIDKHYIDLYSLYSKYNAYLETLSSLVNLVNNYQDTLRQKEYDIKSLEILIKQKENKLQDLYDDLKDYNIYAPINGIIQNVKVKAGDVVSSNTTLAQLVSNEKIIEVSLNEIDAAEVRLGQLAIITFDALPNIKLKGRVFYISPVGEVNQGVVNYLVKVSMENNPQVKIGMTANVEIITKVKKNILTIPNSAIKSINNKYYVEIPDEKENITKITKRPIKLIYPTKKVFIKTGLSDGNQTEILEGLKEGDIIIVKKIENSSNNNQQSQGLFQRLLPNPRQFIPQSRPQNLQKQFQRQ